mmetsp:Transcript_147968/g.210106  ORF Transcript_147968/g.210106 Transcript_147968/m.210106 type:complete len:96 (+) Transcript_147968:110-397(+)
MISTSESSGPKKSTLCFHKGIDLLPDTLSYFSPKEMNVVGMQVLVAFVQGLHSLCHGWVMKDTQKTIGDFGTLNEVPVQNRHLAVILWQQGATDK